MKKQNAKENPVLRKIYEVIFEAETPAGKLFDVLLVIFIILSVVAVCLESVQAIKAHFGKELVTIEWFFTILFTIEYLLRIISVKKPLSYILSFYGVIDLLSILPSYLGLYYYGAQSLHVIRSIRLLRIFRLFKLTRYVGESEVLYSAMKASRHKIIVFLFVVATIVIFMGALMYLIEGDEHGFTSIPKSMYWAIVTMTTVGYGDLAPQTDLGRFFASALMILGYGIIAVPTGIVTAEITNAAKNKDTRTCNNCLLEGHLDDAVHCRRCGDKLDE